MIRREGKDDEMDAKDTLEESVESTCDEVESIVDECVEEVVPDEVKADKTTFKKNKKLSPDKIKIEDLEDRIKRQMAEFENFRKRSQKEKSAMFEVGAKSVIEKMIPVIDNFERALLLTPKEGDGVVFAQGMDMIYKQIMTSLEELGVSKIESVGQPFNPDLHNAVMQVEDSEYEEGIVASELQVGYRYRDQIVRHSMVGVAK